MHFWVHLLRCSDGSYYAGHSDNLEGRLWQHQQGIGCDWTRRRRPVELVWCEAVPTREEALAFERRIKGWTRAKKEALIAGDWDRIGWLARPRMNALRLRSGRMKLSALPGNTGRLSLCGSVPIFPPKPTTQLNSDVALGVAIPSRAARGRIARLAGTVDAILAAHQYPPLV